MQERQATLELKRWTPYVTMLVDRGTRNWQPEDREDVLNDALFHAYRAIVAYDGREGVHISTLIYHYVRKRIHRAYERRRTLVHLQKCREILYSESIFKAFPGMLGQTDGQGDYDSPLEAFPADDERIDERIAARRIVTTCGFADDIEERVVDMLVRGFNMAEIGTTLGISREAVRQRVTKYGDRIRKYVNKQRAAKMLDMSNVAR